MTLKSINISTLKDGKTFLKENYEKGCECPCCAQYVRLYKRKFGSVMARCLIKLYHLGDGYHHVRQIVKGISDTGTNDFSKLRYWRFIEEQKNNDDAKKTSGFWKITEAGKAFVEKKTATYSYVFLYNGKFRGFNDETTTIDKCLTEKFNYEELMKTI